MKYESTPAFARDWKKMKPEHRAMFKDVVSKNFAPACDAWAAAQLAGGQFVWPNGLRATRMRGHDGIWEMTWSFSSPDGRATFEFVKVDDEWRCRWRRIGSHSIYGGP